MRRSYETFKLLVQRAYHTTWHIFVDSPSILHIESLSIFDFERQTNVERMASSRCGKLNVDSTFKFEKISTSFRDIFNVASISNRCNIWTRSLTLLLPFCALMICFALPAYSKLNLNLFDVILTLNHCGYHVKVCLTLKWQWLSYWVCRHSV